MLDLRKLNQDSNKNIYVILSIPGIKIFLAATWEFRGTDGNICRFDRLIASILQDLNHLKDRLLFSATDNSEQNIKISKEPESNHFAGVDYSQK